MRHFPVMRDEAIECLAVQPEGLYLDATVGLGGHAEAIAGRLASGFLIACDRDGESLQMARERLAPFGDRVRCVQAKFSELEATLRLLGVASVHGMIADLGSNYYQMKEPERGFGFSTDGPLDCRMDRSQGQTAAELLNHMSEKELADLIWKAGERGSRKLARAIVRARPIHRTSQLAQVIESASPWSKRQRLHPATRTFMALRMAVNKEMEELDRLLDLLPRLVAPGGRAVIISFHSDEDRRVKVAFRSLAREGRATLLTKRVVRPTEKETRENPPSRSGKLRALAINWQEGRDRHGDAGKSN